jgi:aryl-alcohol dehydrogenase-like predicted oxidoreductase
LRLTTLGRTSLEVTSIGLGLAALGRPGYINLGHGSDLGGRLDVDSMEARTHAVLDAAYDAGVRYFDAARSYGRAEQFLGSWLRARGLDPSEVTVGSKWGYRYTAGWRVDAEVHEVKELTLENLRRQHAESLESLGANLRLYQIHSATLDSGVLDDPAVLEELERLRAGGLAIGLSTSGPRQGETIQRAVETGGFDVVQATWNLLERSAGPALARARAGGIGVIVKEAVANGLLTARGTVAPLLTLAAELGTGADAVALAAVLAQPWVDVVLSGASTVGMLQSNLGALLLSLDSERLGQLDALALEPERYWAQRAALPWN